MIFLRRYSCPIWSVHFPGVILRMMSCSPASEIRPYDTNYRHVLSRHGLFILWKMWRTRRNCWGFFEFDQKGIFDAISRTRFARMEWAFSRSAMTHARPQYRISVVSQHIPGSWQRRWKHLLWENKKILSIFETEFPKQRHNLSWVQRKKTRVWHHDSCNHRSHYLAEKHTL